VVSWSLRSWRHGAQSPSPCHPELILADEPTASLDSQSGQDVVELLGELCRSRGSAVLLVTHDLRLLKEADRIWQIEDGKVEPWQQTP